MPGSIRVLFICICVFHMVDSTHDNYLNPDYNVAFTCQVCPEDHFCLQGAKEVCPDNSTAQEYSYNIEMCTCNMGYQKVIINADLFECQEGQPLFIIKTVTYLIVIPTCPVRKLTRQWRRRRVPEREIIFIGTPNLCSPHHLHRPTVILVAACPVYVNPVIISIHSVAWRVETSNTVIPLPVMPDMSNGFRARADIPGNNRVMPV